MKKLLMPILLCCGLGAGLLAHSPAFGGTAQADLFYQDAVRQTGSANLQQVFELYTRAAELGHSAAQYNIAMMYSNGESVFVDYQQAAYWFLLSAAQNFPPAQYRLGEMYYFGTGGVGKNLEKAVKLFQEAAQQGDADAQMNLAMLLGSGEGVTLDAQQAEQWMRKAELGLNDSATEYLALLQASSDGRFTTEQQQHYWDQQRDFWIREAATLGVKEAQEAMAEIQPRSP